MKWTFWWVISLLSIFSWFFICKFLFFCWRMFLRMCWRCFFNLISEVDKMPWAMGTSSMTSKLTGEGGRMWMSKEMSERQTKAGNQITLSLSHSFNLSFNHSWHAEQLLFSSLCSKLTLTLSHSHSLSLSHSHSFSLSHSFNLSFNHSRHAEQVLFSCLGSKVTVYSRKLQWFFWTTTTPSPSPVSLEFVELVPS